MDLAMSVEARREFLAGVHVGVLGVADGRGDRAPLLVPVWYAYEPDGSILVQTGRESIKAALVRSAGRFSLCVQDESPPYRYVSVEGVVVGVDDPVKPADRKALAYRYLDGATAEAYLAANENQLTEDIGLRMRPRLWRSADFAAFAEEFS